MGKAKKVSRKLKVRDLKTRKTVKGGSKLAGGVAADPDEGGEVTRKMHS